MIKKLVTSIIDLKKPCEPVLAEELEAIVTDLRDSFNAHSHPHKVGLSANQIGIQKKVAYIRVKGREMILVNPKIVSKENKIKSPEQCLSLPGLSIVCDRYENIEVETGLGEERHTEFWDGYESIIIQHETDHLNGFTIIDRKHKRI